MNTNLQKVTNHIWLMLFAASCSWITGCAANSTTSNVQDYHSIDNPIREGESFYPINISETQNDSRSALIEKELIEFASNDLVKKGYPKSSILDSSKFCLIIQWKTSTVKTESRNETVTIPDFESNSSTTQGSINGKPVNLTTTSSGITSKEIQIYVPSIIYHPETFTVLMVSTKAFRQGKIEERYRSESRNISKIDNPLAWAPEHLQKILETFHKSNSDSTGYLGIALNTELSQPVIYDIDESSKLINYLELKDAKLLTVNGISIKYRTQVQQAIKNTIPGETINLKFVNWEGKFDSIKTVTSKIPSSYQLEKPYF